VSELPTAKSHRDSDGDTEDNDDDGNNNIITMKMITVLSA